MTGRTRREFLQAAGVAGAGFWIVGDISPKQSLTANDEIRFACIGVGGQGRRDAQDASRAGRIVAVCDVDERSLAKSAARYHGATPYCDWRKMLDDMDNGIDAVTVSTPDHTHASASIRAMKLGKHCFTQKPLTHTIEEARLMGELARETGVVTEMGNQGTATNGLRQAAAFVQGGGLGQVREVHVWTNRPDWPQGVKRPTDTPRVPETLNWDAWVGPAPMRPYSPVYHPFNWRGWWDFGTGALGDMAGHTMNLPYAACDLTFPTSVQAVTSGHNRDSYPASSVVSFEFPATDKRAALVLKWYDGGERPPEDIVAGTRNNFTSSGAAIIGATGTLYAPGDYASNVELIGSEKMPDVDYVRSPGHFQEWVDAINGGCPPMSNFPDYAGPLTETILLGNLAVWAAPEAGAAGKKIEWDGAKLEATNAPEVMHLVRKKYRRGFELGA